ncbi:non-ribosomal peptide synthetase, partial [Methylobacterium crusticola]|uniref:non-ribosomal peptide synthetase n=1 Tax=Methylobacterium crusticola TaxID=1697972 RepID=UPI0013968A0A
PLARRAAERGPPAPRSYACGGEALARDTVALVQQALAPRFLINGYGPTETVISPLAWKAAPGEAVESAHAPIGRAVGKRRAYVLDPGLEPVPVGVTGELYVSGLLARGYDGAPGVSAAVFLPDPFAEAPGTRMYRTGDLARWRRDGTVEYLGRTDAQVKLRGFRIEPGEVEALLLAQESVAQAAVGLRAGRSGAAQLVGYVVPAAGAALDAGRVRASLRRRLPDYMVPSRLVALPGLPLLGSGKVDRGALAGLALPEDEDGASGAGGGAPAGAARAGPEAVVAAIFARVLGLAEVGRHASFFEAGGDSI